MNIQQWKNNLLRLEISPPAKLLAFILAEHHNSKTNSCYPSITRLCDLTGYGSRNTILKSISELKENNLISVKQKTRKGMSRPSNFYSFCNVNGSLADGSLNDGSVNDSSLADGSLNGSLNGSLGVLEPLEPIEPIKDTKVSKKLSFEDIDNFEDLFQFWNDNKKSGKYKNNKSYTIAFNKLKKLTDNDFAFAKDVIENSIANNYAGFSRGNELFLRRGTGQSHPRPTQNNSMSLREQVMAKRERQSKTINAEIIEG